MHFLTRQKCLLRSFGKKVFVNEVFANRRGLFSDFSCVLVQVPETIAYTVHNLNHTGHIEIIHKLHVVG